MNDLKRPKTYLDLPAWIDRLDTSVNYTSRLYPVLVNEDRVTARLQVRELKFPLVKIGPDELNVSAQVTSLGVRPIRIDSIMPPDSMEVESRVTSIELRPIRIDSIMPPDEIDVSSEVTAIELRQILITNTMKPEGLDVSSEITSIKLEPE